MKQCSSCKEAKGLEQFYKNKSRKDGHDAVCKVCQKAKYKKWSTENPERKAAGQKAWAEANMDKKTVNQSKYNQTDKGRANIARGRSARRARLNQASSTLTTSEWQMVLSLHSNVCAKCGSAEDMQLDHVVPLAKGGTHTLTNVQPLCGPCNRHKHTAIADYRHEELRGLGDINERQAQRVEVVQERSSEDEAQSVAFGDAN